MKAQVLKAVAPIESRPLELIEVPVPQPGPGEILIRVSACGVCHTELDEIEVGLHHGHEPHHREHLGALVEVRMCRLQFPLSDCQRPLVKGDNPTVLAIRFVDFRQIIEALGNFRMIRA